MKKTCRTWLVALSIGAVSAAPAFGELAVKDVEGEHLDVVSGDKILVRYMYANDKSSKERHHETYKPYLHVFDAEGKKPITKGPGGKFTHHRGIFIGWNKIGFGGKTYDRWHMKGGDIVHQEFQDKSAEGNAASIVSLTHWMDGEGKPFLDEQRTMRIMAIGDGPARLLIDFESVLNAKYGDVSLGGDPEHAGIQYRPANEVEVKKTTYLFPAEGVNPQKVTDLHWAAESYTLDGNRHSVVHMNHPDNPKGTKYSAYRDYGRFGAFFTADIPKGEALTVRYRIVILDGELPERSTIENAWKSFAKQK